MRKHVHLERHFCLHFFHPGWGYAINRRPVTINSSELCAGTGSSCLILQHRHYPLLGASHLKHWSFILAAQLLPKWKKRQNSFQFIYKHYDNRKYKQFWFMKNMNILWKQEWNAKFFPTRTFLTVFTFPWRPGWTASNRQLGETVLKIDQNQETKKWKHLNNRFSKRPQKTKINLSCQISH